uniref:Putative ovule protein n=1 Tax=Solanum chacoense TaxID=4108 RepID=A0A0V0H6R6_SOLCH
MLLFSPCLHDTVSQFEEDQPGSKISCSFRTLYLPILQPIQSHGGPCKVRVKEVDLHQKKGDGEDSLITHIPFHTKWTEVEGRKLQCNSLVGQRPELLRRKIRMLY